MAAPFGRARVRLRDGRRPLVAVKELREDAGTRLVDEASLMNSLNHKNILSCAEAVLTQEGKGLWLFAGQSYKQYLAAVPLSLKSLGLCLRILNNESKDATTLGNFAPGCHWVWMASDAHPLAHNLQCT